MRGQCCHCGWRNVEPGGRGLSLVRRGLGWEGGAITVLGGTGTRWAWLIACKAWPGAGPRVGGRRYHWGGRGWNQVGVAWGRAWSGEAGLSLEWAGSGI